MDDDTVSVTEVDFEEYETGIRDVLEEYVTWLEGVVRDAVGPEYETDFDAIVERDLSKFRDPEETTALFLARSDEEEEEDSAEEADPRAEADTTEETGSTEETGPDEEAGSENQTVGFVYLRAVSGTTAVVKRLYVRPAYRGRGIGRVLVTKLVETAAERGYATLQLTTSPGMEEAQELYADLGFEETDPFETEVPEEFHDVCRFMRRSLDAAE